MRILVSWLRDFVSANAGADELGTALEKRGFELAAIEPAPPGGPSGDAVIDLEITANRPDCLSVLGIAREVAAIYALPLRTSGDTASASSVGPGFPPPRSTRYGETRRSLREDGSPANDPHAAPSGDDLHVTLIDSDLCPRYAAAVAEVTVGRSPDWLTYRLEAAGVRPINNIVDITNYVLIEIGQPMHAFDLERLAGRQLVIRRAAAGERVRTLDGQDRALTDQMLVIADRTRPQAIAGVMGGADSEVSAQTRLVAFESATFQPISVRLTSKRLGLKTEASSRFERGTDIGKPVLGLARVCELLERIQAGKPRDGFIDRYPSPQPAITVPLRRTRIQRVLGMDVSANDVEQILTRLDFGVAPAVAEPPETWTVTVPSARVDVSREIDLIEEVARHHGYDRLPATFPPLEEMPPQADPRVRQEREVRRVLTAAGFCEAMTFAFIERSAASPMAEEGDLVPIANPLSEKFAVLRPSLVPGLVDSIAHNRRREQKDVRLFEIGRRFTATGGEIRTVALGWSGVGAPDHWSAPSRTVDLFDVRGVTDRLCEVVGVSPTYRQAQRPGLVPGRTAEIALAPDASESQRARIAGHLGQLLPSVGVERGLGAGDEVYVAELDLDVLAQHARSRDDIFVEPLPRYPSIVRDLTLIVSSTLPAATVRGTIRTAAPDTLVALREFARYEGKGVPEGSTSLSWRLTFRAPDRTLTDSEVQAAIERILEAVRTHHGARLR